MTSLSNTREDLKTLSQITYPDYLLGGIPQWNRIWISLAFYSSKTQMISTQVYGQSWPELNNTSILTHRKSKTMTRYPRMSTSRPQWPQYAKALWPCRPTQDHTVFQILVLKDLRQKVLFLAHYTPVASHPGVARQYYTMRRTFYWPTMMTDIQSVSANFRECSIERVKLKSHQSKLKIFPAKQPLDSLAIDIL
eukprot:IDg10013t1